MRSTIWNLQKSYLTSAIGLSGHLRFYHLYLYSVLSASDNEGSRYFSEETNGPFRSNTWGPQQPIGKS